MLGAGVSGLVTAYEPGKLGYDVRVIEARERVGGLNWTARKGARSTSSSRAAKSRSAISTKVCM